MITLNQGQQEAHDHLVNYLLNRNTASQSWLLKGYAGTGKSTTIGEVLNSVFRYYDEQNAHSHRPTVAVSAPTHKAVHVLKKMQAFSSDVYYATIHSLLGLKEHIDPISGKITFKQGFTENGPTIEAVDILILDETSMLSNELFDLIVPYVQDGMKLVMMGDPVQIPPVNEKDPKPFIESMQARYNISVLELTEIVRQAADNPILAYATQLRKVYKTGNPQPTTGLHEGHGIEVITAADSADRIATLIDTLFCSEEFKEDPDHIKVIAWTNKVVDHYNKHIRGRIYGTLDVPSIQVGERLVCDGPVKHHERGDLVLYTNQELKVISTRIDYKTLYFRKKAQVLGNIESNPFGPEEDYGYDTITLKYYDTMVEYEYINPLTRELAYRQIDIHILHEDSVGDFDKYQKQHRDLTLKERDTRTKGQMWRKYYDNEAKFAWVKYNYAITAHKSQGSTYNNVILLNWDIDKNSRIEERNRIKYVAATRPRHMLYFIK